MGRLLITSFCLVLFMHVGWAQDEQAGDSFRTPGRLVYGNGNKLLAEGSLALRSGDYAEGIRLTQLGLEQSGNSDYLRTSALSNLCAAYAATQEPDEAIAYCGQALEVDTKNWRALSNRAYAHWVKRMHAEAAADLEAAEAINPNSREIAQIRGLINQSTLQPRISVEDRL
jgi:tetratricopeptide (TPR) repeat protein